MPMVCSVCSHLENTDIESCPKCGGVMRMSLLAGTIHDDNTGLITVGGDDRESVGKRVFQILGGAVWVLAISVALGFTVYVAIAGSGMDVPGYVESQPLAVKAIFAFVVCVAVVAMVPLHFGGVYLAQLLAAGSALIGVTGTLVLRGKLGLPVSWYEWVLPVFGAGIGFAVGLRFAGKPAEREVISFKPIDSWDRNAQPTARELNPPVMQNWTRLGIGILVGVSLFYGLPNMIGSFLMMLVHNSSIVDSAMARIEIILQLIALVCAGMIAGSGTRSGLAQGILAGLGIFLLDRSFSPSGDVGEILLRGILVFGGCILGGLLGRKTFMPYRIFGNAKGIKNAPARTQPVTAR